MSNQFSEYQLLMTSAELVIEAEGWRKAANTTALDKPEPVSTLLYNYAKALDQRATEIKT